MFPHNQLPVLHERFLVVMMHFLNTFLELANVCLKFDKAVKCT